MKPAMDSVTKVLDVEIKKCVALANKTQSLKEDILESFASWKNYRHTSREANFYEDRKEQFIDLREKFNQWYHYCKTFLEENGIPENFMNNILKEEEIINSTIDALISNCINRIGYGDFATTVNWLNTRILGIKKNLLSFKSTILAKKDSFLFSLRFDIVEDIFHLANEIGKSQGISKPTKFIASGSLFRVAIERALNIELERKGEKIPNNFHAKTQKLKDLGSLSDFQFKEINEAYGKLCTPSHAKGLDEKEYEKLMNSALHIFDSLKSRV